MITSKVTCLLLLICAFQLLSGCDERKKSSEGLEESVRKVIDAKTFDESYLDSNVIVVLSSGSGPTRTYSHDQVLEWVNATKRDTSQRELLKYRTIDINEKGRYASIVYEVSWGVGTGTAKGVIKTTAHEVWQRVPSGWQRLFAAIQEQGS